MKSSEGEYKIIETKDGSTTLFSKAFQATYHSLHGAISESRHVFINNGLSFHKADPITVLELGFGTGLNAILTYLEALKSERTVHYHTIEAFPIKQGAYSKFDFGLNEVNQEILKYMHDCEWDHKQEIEPNFTFNKYKRSFEEALPTEKFDLVYLDAFGPGVHPYPWKNPFLSDLKEVMNPEGIIVTFCAQGQFKRELKSAGFELERLDGPPGKREMTRATLKI